MVLLHLIAYMILPIVGIGFGYVITNLAQLSLGTNAFVAGALVLPGALIGAFFAPVGGMLYDRFGAFRPILGAFCAAGNSSPSTGSYGSGSSQIGRAHV